jgi:asparagine synthase (glutamine-hydrolysing)
MCGISGYLLKDGAHVDENTLAKMGQRLAHRGPDNISIMTTGNAGFAHTRLSIIDLSDAGNQPFSNGRYVLCFNGEIYNYLELKKYLVSYGVQFASSSDTEVLFYLLINDGVHETLNKIKGMFAFSFYDIEKKELYLCRDRFGIKPLNYYLHDSGVYWASEIKAFLDIFDIKPDPIKTLFSFTGNGENLVGNTIFKNIKQIQPGNFLFCTSGKTPQSITYFDPVDLVDQNYFNELDNYPEKELINEFSILFDKSVNSMLMSDAPIGVFVSGGLDSNLISSYAKRYKSDINLFTANVLGKFSEFSDATLLSNTLNLPLLDYKFEPQMFIRDLTNATYYYECPIIRYSNAIPLMNIAKMARKNFIKPVLTGEGSDELFLGYPDVLYSNYVKYLTWPIESMKKMYGLIPGLKRRINHNHLPDFIANLSNGYEENLLKKKSHDAFKFIPKKSIYRQSLTLCLLQNPLLGLLFRNDRMGMMASIESRFPYLDEELVKFAINLPCRWKMRTTAKLYDIRHPFIVDKYLVRKAAELSLPKRLAKKTKWYFKIHDYDDLSVNSDFFSNGYLQHELGLSSRDLKHLSSVNAPDLLSKLVSIDIFGRIYDMKQSTGEIDSLVQKHVVYTRKLPKPAFHPENLGRVPG